MRAYRICSPEYLHDELEYVKNVFIRLKFPEALLILLQRKAQNIKARAVARTQREKSEKPTYLIVPNSQQAENVAKKLAPKLSIVTVASKKIGQIIKKRKEKKENSDSIVHNI